MAFGAQELFIRNGILDIQMNMKYFDKGRQVKAAIFDMNKKNNLRYNNFNEIIEHLFSHHDNKELKTQFK